jgi:transglutaminase-like putative cysteine protease
VDAKIRFSYPDARPTCSASDSLHEGIGVCRDFAHLAIALCRCMNIPARYCTGYLGDIGVPVDPNPMDFSAWAEVFLDGRWYTIDARHTIPVSGALSQDGVATADVAMSTAFGIAKLARFEVVTHAQVHAG